MPDLKVARTSAYIKDDLAGTSDDGHTGPEKVKGLRGPHIDITFENRANGPSLITKATLKFREMGQLDKCSKAGGELGISANYDFPIPFPLPETPYKVEKEISFEVGTNELDRLTLTAGPETTLGTPWYGIADVVLKHDGGQKQTIGPFALIDTGSDEHFYPSSDEDRWVIETDDQNCLAKTSELTDHLLRTPKVTAAKELKTLQASLAKLGH
ncbi:hypothetical protein [Streptomyces sp. NPDC015345]|uniref:hypothetical protein n=1 Tax=Streptomyces sp. NPDC015345 TaxID=3364953 RepID=UPI0036F5F158